MFVVFLRLLVSGLVVTCWERADLLALGCDVCVFVTFPCGILGQVRYLIVSIPDLCHLSYFPKALPPLNRNFCRLKICIYCFLVTAFVLLCQFFDVSCAFIHIFDPIDIINSEIFARIYFREWR